MIDFLHTYIPHSIAVQWGFLTIRWYGVLMVLAISIAVLVAYRVLCRQQALNRERFFDLVFYVVLTGLLGARIYAVLLEWRYFLSNPFEIIAVWHGGLAIHGALIGGLLATWLWAKKNRVSFFLLLDSFALGIPFGQAIGRWGNYFNQELFGTPTNVAWGIPIQIHARPAAFANATHFHPTFLYESFLNICTGVVLYVVYRYFRPSSGVLTALYLGLYGIIRICMEQLRTDPAPLVLWWRLPVLVSGAMIVISIAMLILSRKKNVV